MAFPPIVDLDSVPNVEECVRYRKTLVLGTWAVYDKKATDELVGKPKFSPAVAEPLTARKTGLPVLTPSLVATTESEMAQRPRRPYSVQFQLEAARWEHVNVDELPLLRAWAAEVVANTKATRALVSFTRTFVPDATVEEEMRLLRNLGMSLRVPGGSVPLTLAKLANLRKEKMLEQSVLDCLAYAFYQDYADGGHRFIVLPADFCRELIEDHKRQISQLLSFELLQKPYLDLS